MQDTQYKEVLIVVIACITLFLILAAIILRFLFMYQRRKLLQQQELADLRQKLSEQSLKSQLEIQEQTFLAISLEIHDNVQADPQPGEGAGQYHERERAYEQENAGKCPGEYRQGDDRSAGPVEEPQQRAGSDREYF